MKSRFSLGAIALTLAIASSPANAASPATTTDKPLAAPAAPVKLGNIAEIGASERVAFSDKLRMYSELMLSSACTSVAGVTPRISKGFLAVGAHEFNRIINALEKGDRALGIVGSEENARTRTYIAQLRDAWEPKNELVKTILAQGPTAERAAALAEHNSKLLKLSETTVAVISGQYSDPSVLLQSDAIRLGIAGRQRMLTQRMSTAACMLQIGVGDDNTRTDLKATIAQFDISLLSLQSGLPAAGVYASEDPAILAGLATVRQHWSEIRYALDAVVAGAEWDDKIHADVYTRLNVMMHEMDKVVILYTKDSKHNL